MLLLNVPYLQKDEAKALGARWNPQLKKWYVSERNMYSQFSKWLDGQLIVANQIYIVEAVRICPRCKKETIVIGFGIDCCFDIYDKRSEPYNGDINICMVDSKIPEGLAAFLEQTYGFKRSYSKTMQAYCNGNRCCHCNALQGNYFLFEEVDSPFFIDGKESAQKLTLHKINLPFDISVNASIGYGSEDELIREYATIHNSNLKWE